MDNRGNAQNPASVLGSNEYAPMRINLSRPDTPVLAPGANTVDPAALNRTFNVLDKNETPAKPLGQVQSSGW